MMEALSKAFGDLVVVSIGALVAMAVVTALLLWVALRVKKSWRNSWRDTLSGGILRPPGWGCIERREDALAEASMLIVATMIFWGILAYAAIMDSKDSVVGLAIVLVPTTVFSANRIRKLVLTARTAWLGFLGEALVAEKLVTLIADGWHVFHDVPMESNGKHYNIDHVVVGKGGVFVLETKARSRSVVNLRGNWKVTVDGDIVNFPDGRKKDFTKQARGNARSLRNLLNDAGIPVSYVKALVVLPGWSVSYRKDGNQAICEAENVAGQIMKEFSKINEQLVDQIVKEMDRRCRILRFDEENPGAGK